MQLECGGLPLVHREEDEERTRPKREEHACGTLYGGVVKVEGHRTELEDDDVERGGQVGEEARERILRGRRIQRRVVDLVTQVRIALVHVLEHSDGKTLEWADVWSAPAHERAVHPIVSHAALVRLVEAAAILCGVG